MVRGKMCVSVGPNRIMCRIDPALHDEAVKRKGASAVVMKGREYRGWVRVDADSLKSARDLANWIELALDFNAHAKASQRKTRKS
jgi:hypothetical protein